MRTIPALLTTIAVFALVACTDDDPADATTSPTTTAEVTSTATAAPSPAATTTPRSTTTPPPVTNRNDIPRVAPGTDHPSIGLDAEGIPLDAEGTLVIYAKELSREPDVEVIVFDLERGEPLSSFPIEANGNFSIQLAGKRILASFGSQLWSYALDGSDGRLLDEGLPGVQMLPSPDGRYVTITGWGEGLLASVAIIEVGTGDHLVTVDLADELPDWMGEPFPNRWLTDGELLVGGLCHCDGSPEGFFDAIVGVDGSVERAPSDLAAEKPVRIEVADGFTPGCALVSISGGKTVRLIDTATESVLAEATDGAPVLLGGELSPDGTEALINLIEADEALRDKLNSALERGDCYEGPETSFGASGWSLGILQVGAHALAPVDSRLDVFQRWYGDDLPIFTCDEEKRAGVDTTAWFDHVPWRDPAGFGGNWGFTSGDCEGRATNIAMTIAGIEVDTAASGYRVLGFIEVTPTSED